MFLLASVILSTGRLWYRWDGGGIDGVAPHRGGVCLGMSACIFVRFYFCTTQCLGDDVSGLENHI